MININNFNIKNNAKVYTINAPSIESTNEVQENIKITEKEISITNSFIYNFPAHSINIIEFDCSNDCGELSSLSIWDWFKNLFS